MNKFVSTPIWFYILFWMFCGSVLAADRAERYAGRTDLHKHYQQAKFFYNQLQTTSTLGASRENWLKGAGNFRRLYLAEPKSEWAPSCLFMLGRVYHDMYKKFGKGIDLGESISYYRDVDALFPGNRLADDALYAVGTILFEDVKDPKRAAKSFKKIVSEYPESDMRAQAETKLKVLSKDFDIPLPQIMIGNAQLMKLTNVLPVKYWSSKDYTRVVIKTSGPVAYREVLLEKIGDQPRRLYIDFKDSYIEPRYRLPVPIEDGLLKRIRTGQFSPDTVRVVLDIESISTYKIFSLPDPFRVVIDVRGTQKQQLARAPVSPFVPPQRAMVQQPGLPAPSPVQTPQKAGKQDQDTLSRPSTAPPVNPEVVAGKSEPAGQESTQPAPGPIIVLKENKKATANGSTIPPIKPPITDSDSLSLAQQLGLGVGTIVIDPGHGGKDPGAIAFGMKEKDIVLRVGQRLAEKLREDLDARVILTRENDEFLPLEERTAIANTNDADLFISLHINAHPSPQVKGFETYFLNLSTNEEAMRVAARENATSTHQMSDLQDILSDIMQNSKINESSRLAQQVHSSIVMELSEPPFKLKNMGVKQAPFYVLIGAEMPAILIELAFISNPEDARLLADEQFIHELAGNIASGIREYVNTNTAQL
jgi:N-acetylmuramoyl-L-alanine amidase